MEFILGVRMKSWKEYDILYVLDRMLIHRLNHFNYYYT